MPKVLEIAEIPARHELPEVPEMREVPDIPEVPEVPEIPEVHLRYLIYLQVLKYLKNPKYLKYLNYLKCLKSQKNQTYLQYLKYLKYLMFQKYQRYSKRAQQLGYRCHAHRWDNPNEEEVRRISYSGRSRRPMTGDHRVSQRKTTGANGGRPRGLHLPSVASVRLGCWRPGGCKQSRRRKS